jgi:hypothetical protein
VSEYTSGLLCNSIPMVALSRACLNWQILQIAPKSDIRLSRERAKMETLYVNKIIKRIYRHQNGYIAANPSVGSRPTREQWSQNSIFGPSRSEQIS